MKLEALDHPKTLDFASRLAIRLPTAIGHLELFWAFTGKKAPRGNVGKWPDGAISMACMWDGPSEQFIAALVDSGLVDHHPEHRLIVHDWHEHAPNWVKAKLAKAKEHLIGSGHVSSGVSGHVSAGVSGDREAGTGTDIATDARTDTRSSRARVLPREVKGSEEKIGSATDVATDTGSQSVASETRRKPPIDSFELVKRIQAIYPAGMYRDQVWQQAARELGMRLADGEDPEQLVQAAVDYGAQQVALGKVGSQFVLSPAKFYGQEGHWRGPFPMPAKSGKPDPVRTWEPPDDNPEHVELDEWRRRNAQA